MQRERPAHSEARLYTWRLRYTSFHTFARIHIYICTRRYTFWNGGSRSRPLEGNGSRSKVDLRYTFEAPSIEIGNGSRSKPLAAVKLRRGTCSETRTTGLPPSRYQPLNRRVRAPGGVGPGAWKGARGAMWGSWDLFRGPNPPATPQPHISPPARGQAPLGVWGKVPAVSALPPPGVSAVNFSGGGAHWGNSGPESPSLTPEQHPPSTIGPPVPQVSHFQTGCPTPGKGDVPQKHGGR